LDFGFNFIQSLTGSWLFRASDRTEILLDGFQLSGLGPQKLDASGFKQVRGRGAGKGRPRRSEHSIELLQELGQWYIGGSFGFDGHCQPGNR